jgi:23S rRNA (guanosine2251-2'-O)-methyltransferase
MNVERRINENHMVEDNVVFGINAILQLLQNRPEKILVLYVSSERHDKRIDQIIALAKSNDLDVQRIDRKKIDQWFAGQNHQGIAAKIAQNKALGEADLKRLVESTDKPLFLVLDGVQDPHNLGACLRTANAAGVTAVIVPRDNAASITPIVRKVASGAADLIPFVQVSNLARALRELQQLGVWMVGTSGDAEQSIYQVDLTGSIAIVMGAEGEGIRELTRKHCDFLAYIPMLGQVESLNVSVATGICLYEAVRQRGK